MERITMTMGPFMSRPAREMTLKRMQFAVDRTGSEFRFVIPTDKTPFPQLHLKYALMVEAFPLCPWAYLADVETGKRYGWPWPWLNVTHSLKQCGKRLKLIAAEGAS